MAIPFQIIPYEEKTEKWAEGVALHIYRTSRLDSGIKDRTKFCYSFYNGEVNQSDYDYLRKSGDYEYPALVRHIPLLKTMFDNLRSEEIKRPFKFRTFTIDKASLDRKKEAYKEGVLDFFRQKHQERMDQLSNAMEQLAMFEQQAAQAQEQGQQVDPVVLKKIQEQKQILNNKSFIVKEEIDKLEKYYRMEYRDILESLSQKCVTNMIKSHNMPYKFNQGFEDLIVCDGEFYWIRDNGISDPDTEVLDPNHFYYSMDDVDWVKDCQWGMYEKLTSFNGIVDLYPNIEPTKLEELQNRAGSWLDYNASTFHSNNTMRTDGYGPTYHDGDNVIRGSQVKLSYIFWQSPRQVYFYDIIDEEGRKISKYALSRKDVPQGLEIEVRFINEVWEALIADGDITLYARKCEKQIYDSKWRNQGLPFGGRNKWGRKKTNSKVWETKDLQIMYNLVHYHKELWLALSGVKGFIMDKSQIPDDMNPEEWMYQRKMGVAWIETVKKNKRVQTSFNQFQHYDDTVAASIQYLLKILEHYERLASYVTGVSQQRLGMLVSTDQVGTTESSIQQSNLTTEILFIEHEMTKRHVLGMWLNIAKTVWDKNGKYDQYIDDDLTQHIISIPKGTMGGADYDIFVVDGGKEQGQIQMLQQLVMQGRQQGAFDIPAAAKLLLTENVREMEKMLDYYSDKAMEQASSAAQQQQEAEAQKQQMDLQVKQMIAQQQARMQEAQMQVDGARLEFDKQKLDREIEFEREKLEKEIAIKKQEIDSERQVELLYLDFEKKKAVYDAEVNKIQIQLDAVNQQMKTLTDAKNKEKIKDK